MSTTFAVDQEVTIDAPQYNGKFANVTLTVKEVPEGRKRNYLLALPSGDTISVNPNYIQAAKKRRAKKTVATAKKTTRTRKTTTPIEGAKPTPADSPMGQDDIAKLFTDSIKSGAFDNFLIAIDDALTERANAREAERAAEAAAKKKEAAAQAVKTTAQKAAPPQRQRSAEGAVAKPVKGKVYVLSDGIRKGAVAGKRVKFVRPSQREGKSIIEMVDAVPGAPAGKQITVPTDALREAPAQRTRKAPAKKAAPAAKKGTRRVAKK